MESFFDGLWVVTFWAYYGHVILMFLIGSIALSVPKWRSHFTQTLQPLCVSLAILSSIGLTLHTLNLLSLMLWGVDVAVVMTFFYWVMITFKFLIPATYLIPRLRRSKRYLICSICILFVYIVLQPPPMIDAPRKSSQGTIQSEFPEWVAPKD